MTGARVPDKPGSSNPEQSEPRPEALSGAARPFFSRSWAVLAGLACLLGLAFLTGLGNGSLLNSDDALYASMGREMARSGNLLTITYQGLPVFEKPPLLFWLMQPAYKVLGFGDLAARLPCALTSVAMLLLLAIWALGSHLASFRARLFAAFIVSGLAASSWLVFFNGRRVMTDMPFWLACFLLFHWVSAPGGHRQRLWAGLALALALLAKGTATAPAILAMILWGLLQKKWRSYGARDWAGLLLPSLFLALPWFLHQSIVSGPDFLNVQFGLHVLGRMGGALYSETGPAFYLERVLELEGLPFSLLVLLGFFCGAAFALRIRQPRDSLLMIFGVTYLLLISVMQTRLEHYVLPLVLIGLYFASLALAAALERTPGLPGKVTLAAALVLMIAFFFVSHNMSHLLLSNYSPNSRRLASAVAGASGLLVSLNDYEVAAGWYADRRLEQWTTDPRLCSILSAADMLTRSRSLWCGTEKELLARISQESPVLFGRGTLGLVAEKAERLKGYCWRSWADDPRLLLLPTADAALVPCGSPNIRPSW